VLEDNMSQPDPLGPIPRRLASCIRLLLSANPSERAAAMLGVQRILQTVSTDKDIDLHAFADRIETVNGLSEAFKQEVRTQIEQARATGYAEGVQAAEAKQHNTGAFRNTDGSLEWSEVALFLQGQKHRLPERHQEFIDDMASRTVWGRELTPKQHQYLHSLFFKLGGKIT
jgi:hypothetical protein